ncbi:MAG: sigma-54-dependent Fis family transcriptional regulator [Deltaproteobacteria bacterium]|nr:sigma-54-dependent Fis family transcriptional regulator [Deltaproteobacteria bacterium]
MASVLVVDDEPGIREFLQIMLDREGYDVSCAANGREAINFFKKKRYDVVVADIRMPKVNGFEVLTTIKEISPETNVIMITAYASFESAVESMKEGAYDYITKPFNVDEVKMTVKNALQKKGAVEEVVDRKREKGGVEKFEGMISISPEMLKIFALIPKAASSKASVLITGESGTGKELVARAIHQNSPRSNEPFVTINCGGVPEQLLESELFGYKKGAFTGAVTDKIGLFEAAHKGTIFLDEIGDLPLSLQVKLLRIVQEKSFKPLGGTQEISIDVRIISATNINLEEKVIKGEFREDLFYRLNVIQIRIPSLRERKMDIPILAQHFLEKYSQESGKEIRQISSYALKVLLDYSFPGNVRELENIVERSVALETSNIILPDSLTLSRFKKEMSKNGETDLDIPSEGIDLEEEVGKLEKQLLLKALQRTNGEMKKAAELLNIPYRSIRYRLEKYGIKNGKDVVNHDA